jgi:hypothetical protein
MPDFGAKNPGNGHPDDDDAGINVQLAPADFALKREKSGHKGHPHQQPKRADIQRSNMNVGIQSVFSTDGVTHSIKPSGDLVIG